MKNIFILISFVLGISLFSVAQSPLCTSYPSTFGFEYVSSVTINGVTRDGNIGFEGPGYYDYTGSILTTMTAGTSVPVSVTVVTNNNYQEFVKIWFDFNGNLNLEDAGDLVFDQNQTFNGTYVYSGNVAIPANAFNGEVYLRVIMVFSADPQLCGAYSYGNTFDFKATLTGGLTSRSLTVATAGTGGYTGNVTSTPSGISTSDGIYSANFPDGATVTLTPTPSGEAVFGNWTGDATGSSNPLAVTMTADKDITANFVAPATPADPTSVTATYNPVCNGAGTTLTCNGAVGTVYWYTASCGGTQTSPPTGNTIVVSPATSTRYYARNYNNSLFSAGCAYIDIDVTPKPTVASLTATGSSVGAIIKWYSASSGGTQYNGTETLVNGQTYYASQTINGCESATRLAVTVTMSNPYP